MRYFIAISLPEEIKREISNFKFKKFKGVKFADSENIHLTLLFLGERNDVEEISSILRLVQFNKFRVTISGFGFFPDDHNIRVAWMGVKSSPNLISLQKQIAILFKDYKKYVPHLTFARIKRFRGREKEEFLQTVKTFQTKEFSFEVDKFRLYSSDLTRIGPIHRVVDNFSSST